MLAACGGSTPAAEAPAQEPAEEPAATAEAPAQAQAKTFDDMSEHERAELMKNVVLPEMTTAFQSFDKEEFAQVNCVTCHGPGAKEGEFDMPNKDLPSLNQAEMDEHPEMTKFMMEVVVPKMAKMLGEEPYNPQTHEGFGCFDCHTKKE